MLLRIIFLVAFLTHGFLIEVKGGHDFINNGKSINDGQIEKNPYILSCTTDSQCKTIPNSYCWKNVANDESTWRCACQCENSDCSSNRECCSNNCKNGLCNGVGTTQGSACYPSDDCAVCGRGFYCQPWPEATSEEGYCNRGVQTTQRPISTTTTSVETSYFNLFIVNPDDFYNTSLLDHFNAYYINRVNYYEQQTMVGFQNTTNDFIVADVTVKQFSPPKIPKNIYANVGEPGLKVEMYILVKALPGESLPSDNEIEDSISETVVSENPSWVVESISTNFTDSCIWPSPFSLAKIAPTFMVFARSNATTSFNVTDYQQIQSVTDHLLTDGYIRSRVVFLVHGFQFNIDSPWLTDTAELLLEVEDDMVIAVGWGNGADLPGKEYDQSCANTMIVSDAVAVLAQSLKDNAPLASYFYCIGHSLGAHICGQVGRQFQLDRISGLDPAGPSFQNCPSNLGLNKDSAECVDNIHTNGIMFGTMNPLGDVDFYASCGEEQPSCTKTSGLGCSHGRAIDYFMESINASLTNVYPMAQGPCSDSYFEYCQPCSVTGCPNANCPSLYSQVVGFGSVCYGGKKTKCDVKPPGNNYFGVWYIPVNGVAPYFIYTCGLNV